MRKVEIGMVSLKAYPSDYLGCFHQDNWEPCSGRISKFVNVLHQKYLSQRRCAKHPLLSEFGWAVE